MKKPIFNKNWSEDVRRVYEHDMQEIWDESIAPHIFNMYHSHLELYFSLVTSDAKNILDVGCAQATLALKLAEKGHSVTAVDLRPEFLEYAKTRWTEGDVEFLQGNVFEIDIDKKFDVIFANQIIEHLVYPEEFVKKLSLLLKPGGKIIMTTPNFEYIKNHHPSYTELGDPKQWEHKQFTADGDGHFFAYSSQELETIFNSAGLTSVSCSYYETPWISGHMKFRYLHKFLPYSLLNGLDKITRRLPLKSKFCHQLLVSGETKN